MPARARTVALGAGVLVLGLLGGLPAAAATEPSPQPVETEFPGGAACLPGGPISGCPAPAPAPRPTPSPRSTPVHRSPRPAPTAGSTTRATTALAAPHARESRRSGHQRLATPTPTRNAPAPAGRSPVAGPAPVAPRSSAVAYEQAVPVDPGVGSDPGWLGPVATALIVLLGFVLGAGPARRLGRHRTRNEF